MSGLDINIEKILEIGIIVTDSKFGNRVIGPNLVI